MERNAYGKVRWVLVGSFHTLSWHTTTSHFYMLTSTKALFISLFKRFYNPTSSPAPLSSPLQSLRVGWGREFPPSNDMFGFSSEQTHPETIQETRTESPHQQRFKCVPEEPHFEQAKDTLNTQCLELYARNMGQTQIYTYCIVPQYLLAEEQKPTKRKR